MGGAAHRGVGLVERVPVSQPEYILRESDLRERRRANVWRRICFAVVVLFLILAAAHQAAALEKIEAWTDEKLGRVARAKRVPLDPARIWSQRCERRGMDALAKRADTNAWQIHCLPRTVLQVPPA